MKIKNAYNLSQLSPPPIKWAVDNFLPLNTVGDISSPPDCGKSTLILSLLTAIANGEPTWFGRKITNGRVVIIGGEKSSDDAWSRDLQRSGKVTTKDGFPICEPEDFLWNWKNSQLVKTSEYSQVVDFLKATSPVMTVIDTIARATKGYDPMQIVQQTLLAREVEELQKAVGGTLLTISHTSQSSQSLELHQRLDYTARSGGNGYPGWLRWLSTLTTLTEPEKIKMGIDPRIRVVAVAVSKPSEMPVPEVGNKHTPWLFEFAADGSMYEIRVGAEMTAKSVKVIDNNESSIINVHQKSWHSDIKGVPDGKKYKNQIFVNPIS
jgi:AAA domain-containing protein